MSQMYNNAVQIQILKVKNIKKQSKEFDHKNYSVIANQTSIAEFHLCFQGYVPKM